MQPITIITPCYNESRIVICFLESMEDVLSLLPYSFQVVVVNDCSTDDTLQLLNEFRFRSAHISLHVVSLASNCGHQAAIYQGFLHAASLPGDRIIVMDSDGEDAPAVIPLLLEERGADVVNVVRSKRSEPLMFRISYSCYKVIFRLITGQRMNYGNFCLISRAVMERAIEAKFTHLAAFLSRQKYPTRYVTANRESRIGGRSKMSFRKLLRHALLSFAEYGYDRQLRFFKRAISR